MIRIYTLPCLWILSFLCGLFFINDWQLELFGISIIVLFMLSCYKLIQNQQWNIPNAWPLKIMAAFWFLVFLSILGSDILSVSLMAFCLFSALPITFFLFSIFANKETFILTSKLLIIVYVGLSLWALVQFFILSEYFNGRAHHPLANPNSFAALLSLGFFCSVGWMLIAKNTIKRNAALIISILIFSAMMAAGSRGALFALLPTLGIFLYCVRHKAKTQTKPLLILLFFCGLAFFLTSTGANEAENLFNRVVENVTTENTGGINSFTNNRLNLWAASWEMIKNHGLIGTGIGTYFLYFPEFRLGNDPFGAYYAHNDPIQYWIELGILGPILFYTFIISIIIRTIQSVRICKNDYQKLMILTPFFALGAMVVHTHITFNLYNLSILYMAGFLLAAWFFATQNVLKTNTKAVLFDEKYTNTLRPLMITLPFIMIGGIFSAYIIGEHYNNKARDHLLAGELEDFTDDVLFAQKIGLNGNYRPYLLAVNVPLGLLEEKKSQLNIVQKRAITKLAFGYIKHVRHINPRSSSALYYMGKIQQIGAKDTLQNDLLKPENYYENALKIDPLHIGARLALADIYQTNGAPKRALETLERGLSYRYTTSNAMNLYSATLSHYLTNGESKKRDDVLRKMKQFQLYLSNQEKKRDQSLETYIWGK